MKYNIRIPQSVNEISKGMLSKVLPEIKKDFLISIKQIRSELPGIVHDIVTSAPEYNELLSGRLRLELGIPDAASKIAELISHWSSNVQIKFTPPAIKGLRITGSFGAYMFKADFEDVLGSEAAYVVDGIRGYTLPWLEWLLLKGNAPIIDQHIIVFGSSSRSRTGGAIMRSARRGDWGVPREYSGDISNNWITRSIDRSYDRVQSLLDRSFT